MFTVKYGSIYSASNQIIEIHNAGFILTVDKSPEQTTTLYKIGDASTLPKHYEKISVMSDVLTPIMFTFNGEFATKYSADDVSMILNFILDYTLNLKTKAIGQAIMNEDLDLLEKTFADIIDFQKQQQKVVAINE